MASVRKYPVMYAMHVIPEWIERPDLLFGVEVETVFAADASVFA